MNEKVRALERLRAEMRSKNAGWIQQCAEVGDFTYATNPRIWTWGQDARLYIGKFCSIGANVQFLLGGEHHTEWITTYPFNVLLKDVYPSGETCAKTKGNIKIGNDVWIGNDAKILSGVTVGDGAVIASSAVVTRNVLPYEIVAGNPATSRARKKRYRIQPYEAWRIWQINWWDWPLEKIAEAIPLMMGKSADDLIEFDKKWSEVHE